MKKVAILILFMLGCAISEGHAQKVALKSNLLYDATTTMNLGLEIGLVRKWTLDIPVNYNPWKLSDGKRLRHWGVQPEVRYWFLYSSVFSESTNILRKSHHHKDIPDNAYAAYCH